jgi:hypothetical protein
VVQIAGLVARRIVGFVSAGDSRAGAGERFGLIRFGSRVDVYLPVGTKRAGRPKARRPWPARRSWPISAADPERAFAPHLTLFGQGDHGRFPRRCRETTWTSS